MLTTPEQLIDDDVHRYSGVLELVATIFVGVLGKSMGMAIRAVCSVWSVKDRRMALAPCD